MKRISAVIAVSVLLAACGQGPAPDNSDYGPNPTLSAPSGGLLPTIKTATPVGWAASEAPVAPEGFIVTRFAEDLDHPRWIYVLPNGDVLVAKSSTERTEGGGIQGWARNRVQEGAGAIGVSADRITLLRDSDGDGDVDERGVFLEGLNQPFGMALIGDYFYVGNTDAVVRFRYTPGALRPTGEAQRVLALPYRAEGNGHWTRNLLASADGSKLYVAVGSMSNVGDAGMEVEEGRAAIWEMNPDGSDARQFASGLRNPVGMSWEPSSGALWVSVNERDMLGDTLVPDYMTHVEDGAFYGWPYYYWGDHRDDRIAIPENVRLRAPTAPDFALGAHTASLGLHFYTAAALSEHYRGGAFVGQHGSWNRSHFVGYRVAFVPFANGRPTGAVEDFLTGFLNERGEARGRPVGVTTDRTGAILVADDVGDVIWRVAPR